MLAVIPLKYIRLDAPQKNEYSPLMHSAATDDDSPSANLNAAAAKLNSIDGVDVSLARSYGDSSP